MIDWLSFAAPITHYEPINSGHVVSSNQDGTIEWKTCKRLPVRGSYESNLNIKSDESTFDPLRGCYTHILIDGNPAKWLQGHNVFGTDDVLGLAVETVLKIIDLFSLTPNKEDYNKIYKGEMELSHIDVNYLFSLENQSQVLALIKALGTQARLKHRGTGIMKGGTLYFGKHSRRWALKIYSKFEEITSNKKGHSLPKELDLIESLKNYSKNKIRIELVLRKMQLTDIKLNKVKYWFENTPIEIFKEYISGIEMSKQIDLSNNEIEKLKPSELIIYKLWKTGEDLRSLYLKNTFYRHRRALLKYGIDITIQQPKEKEITSNVIPFIQVLEARQVESVPDWAIGTDLYFEPRYFANN